MQLYQNGGQLLKKTSRLFLFSRVGTHVEEAKFKNGRVASCESKSSLLKRFSTRTQLFKASLAL